MRVARVWSEICANVLMVSFGDDELPQKATVGVSEDIKESYGRVLVGDMVGIRDGLVVRVLGR